MKTRIPALALGCAIGLAAGAAHAAQITIANSAAGYYSFSGTGGGALNVAGAAAHGTALFGSDLGGYTLGPLAWLTSGTISGGNFAIHGSQALAYHGVDGDSLAGTVGWSLLKDDSPNPDLIGTLTISARSGDATFLSTFAGAAAAIDIALENLSRGVFLSALSHTTGSETAVISSGEIVGRRAAVPEPSTLALLGVSLLGLAWWLRRPAGALAA
ncbi:MAG: PEP-CTERM sorting domain-containing protein [Candidatus Binataceae bacterium]|nr:PEP-CTERM sorting domain-containing protein [Candidatus Binataceae bacterium]